MLAEFSAISSEQFPAVTPDNDFWKVSSQVVEQCEVIG